MGLRLDLNSDSVPGCTSVCVFTCERECRSLYTLLICCVSPSTVNFDCVTSPKSRHFAQVSNPLYTNTENPTNPSPSPSLIGRAPLLCYRRALPVPHVPHVWTEKTCMVQAPGRALMETCSAIWRAVSSVLLVLFFLLPPLLSYMHVSDKRWLWWVPASIYVLFQFKVLFILVSCFVSQAFSQRDLFLIQAPVFFS